MDPQIEELKQLVRQNIAVTEDTRRMVTKMQSAARTAMVMRAVIWVVIIGFSIYSLMSVAPYLSQALEAYSGAEALIDNFRGQY